MYLYLQTGHIIGACIQWKRRYSAENRCLQINSTPVRSGVLCCTRTVSEKGSRVSAIGSKAIQHSSPSPTVSPNCSRSTPALNKCPTNILLVLFVWFERSMFNESRDESIGSTYQARLRVLCGLKTRDLPVLGSSDIGSSIGVYRSYIYNILSL